MSGTDLNKFTTFIVIYQHVNSLQLVIQTTVVENAS